MTQSSTPAPTHSLESIYETLQNRRRRLVLHYLRDAPDGVAQVGAVKERVHEWEAGGSRTAGIDSDDGALVTALHHVHLPMLAERGIIDFDWRTKTIRYRPDDTLEAHLDLAEKRDLK